MSHWNPFFKTTFKNWAGVSKKRGSPSKGLTCMETWRERSRKVWSYRREGLWSGWFFVRGPTLIEPSGVWCPLNLWLLTAKERVFFVFMVMTLLLQARPQFRAHVESVRNTPGVRWGRLTEEKEEQWLENRHLDCLIVMAAHFPRDQILTFLF